MTPQENLKSSKAAYWMVVGLVVLLILPPVIGHFVMKPEATPSVHADASQQ